jgi:cytochrome c oxidase cbb3-type subunit I/II
LHRIGGKYPDAWHNNHLENPRSTSPGSIMPNYPWLLSQTLDTTSLPARIKALRKVGVPYPEGFENGPAQKDLQAQSEKVVADLKAGMITAQTNKEIIAVIAYLQRLGTDIKAAPVSGTGVPPVSSTASPGPAETHGREARATTMQTAAE